MYRDAKGSMLLPDCFTNGPEEKSWDSWAKQSPKADKDTRDGRAYVRNVLKVHAVEGIPDIQKWMRNHLMTQKTGAIKDDWAWWKWNSETPDAGKLMTLLGGQEETKQLFMDDNVELLSARIVDCRDANGASMSSGLALNRHCVKVNPVEAMLDEHYFIAKLQRCHGEHMDVQASLVPLQKQLTDFEALNSTMTKQMKTLARQFKSLAEENQKLKLLHRLHGNYAKIVTGAVLLSAFVAAAEHLRKLLNAEHLRKIEVSRCRARTPTLLRYVTVLSGQASICLLAVLSRQSRLGLFLGSLLALAHATFKNHTKPKDCTKPKVFTAEEAESFAQANIKQAEQAASQGLDAQRMLEKGSQEQPTQGLSVRCLNVICNTLMH